MDQDGVATQNSATIFTGCVQTLPPLQPGEKLVLSQVLVPPLAAQYDMVLAEWIKQERWRDENFIELLEDGCDDEEADELCSSVEAFLSTHMDLPVQQLKRVGDPRWKLLVVQNFETSMRDPGVSSNVEKYVVPQTDPCKALRGEDGLRTTRDCSRFAVGVYRSRTMSELPTYNEFERTHAPAGFPGSVYTWVLRLDQYAVDGTYFVPHWMPKSAGTKAVNKKKKTKSNKQEAAMWEEGYRLVHSAYGYGNETVLANDPHEQPFSGLDNPQAVERAQQKSNTCVKCFRIGPWVFPIELTLKPLSAGTPLLYFYDRDYWSTARASLALANMADTRERSLRSSNTVLAARNDQFSSENDQLRSSNIALQLQLQRLKALHVQVAKELVEPCSPSHLPSAEAEDQGLQHTQITPRVIVETPNAAAVKEGSSAVPAAQLDGDMRGSNGQIQLPKPPEDPLINSDTTATSTAMLPAHANRHSVPAFSAQIGSFVGIGQQSLADIQADQAAATGTLAIVQGFSAHMDQMQAQWAATARQLTAQQERVYTQGEIPNVEQPETGNLSQKRDDAELQPRQSSNTHGQSAPARVDQQMANALIGKEAMAAQASKALSSATQLPAEEPMLTQLHMDGTLLVQHHTSDGVKPVQIPDDSAAVLQTSSVHRAPGYDTPSASGTHPRKDHPAEVSSSPQLPDRASNDPHHAQQEQLHWGGKKKRKRLTGRMLSNHPQAAGSVWHKSQTTPATEEQESDVHLDPEPPEKLNRAFPRTTTRNLAPVLPPLQRPALFRHSSQALDAVKDSTAAVVSAQGIADTDVAMADVLDTTTAFHTGAAVNQTWERQAGATRSEDVINTPSTRLVCAANFRVNVGSCSEPDFIPCSVYAMPGKPEQRYILSTQTSESLGLRSINGSNIRYFFQVLGKKVAGLNRCSGKALPTPSLPKKAYAVSSCPSYVLSPQDIKTLCMPGVLDEHMRQCLCRYASAVWPPKDSAEQEPSETAAAGPATAAFAMSMHSQDFQDDSKDASLAPEVEPSASRSQAPLGQRTAAAEQFGDACCIDPSAPELSADALSEHRSGASNQQQAAHSPAPFEAESIQNQSLPACSQLGLSARTMDNTAASGQHQWIEPCDMDAAVNRLLPVLHKQAAAALSHFDTPPPSLEDFPGSSRPDLALPTFNSMPPPPQDHTPSVHSDGQPSCSSHGYPDTAGGQQSMLSPSSSGIPSALHAPIPSAPSGGSPSCSGQGHPHAMSQQQSMSEATGKQPTASSSSLEVAADDFEATAEQPSPSIYSPEHAQGGWLMEDIEEDVEQQMHLQGTTCDSDRHDDMQSKPVDPSVSDNPKETAGLQAHTITLGDSDSDVDRTRHDEDPEQPPDTHGNSLVSHPTGRFAARSMQGQTGNELLTRTGMRHKSRKTTRTASMAVSSQQSMAHLLHSSHTLATQRSRSIELTPSPTTFAIAPVEIVDLTDD